MRISYYSDTDTLYIELKDMLGTRSMECADDLVLDLNSEGEPIGIEIENASAKVELARLYTSGLASLLSADASHAPTEARTNRPAYVYRFGDGATLHLDRVEGIVDPASTPPQVLAR